MNPYTIKTLAIIVAVIVILLMFFMIYNQIKEHYSQDDPKLKELKKSFEDFFSQEKYWTSPLDSLNNRNIMNEISLYRGDKSYTINKEKVYICLKDDKSQYYGDNTLIYVMAHELAHTLSESIGHTEEFHTIFEALLVKLTEYGIYDPSLTIEQDYCANGDSEA